jgi:hypothetical protein
VPQAPPEHCRFNAHSFAMTAGEEGILGGSHGRQVT